MSLTNNPQLMSLIMQTKIPVSWLSIIMHILMKAADASSSFWSGLYKGRVFSEKNEN